MVNVINKFKYYNIIHNNYFLKRLIIIINSVFKNISKTFKYILITF